MILSSRPALDCVAHVIYCLSVMLPFPQLCLPEAPQQATVTSVPTSEDCHDEWSTWRMQGLVYMGKISDMCSSISVLESSFERCLRKRWLDIVIAEVDDSRLESR